MGFNSSKMNLPIILAQVGVCGLADNRPGDRYRYEIAIWTGMRRNAGTRSEVSIILSGDKNDSNPRSLVNPHSSGFTRASLEKFLLTTSKVKSFYGQQLCQPVIYTTENTTDVLHVFNGPIALWAKF